MKPVFIGIGGEPGTGKSTLMQHIMAQCGTSYTRIEKSGLMVLTVLPHSKLAVMGRYRDPDWPFENLAFPGTDTLSMGVMGKLDVWGPWLLSAFPGYAIMWEGDRMFNARFMEWVHLNSKWQTYYLRARNLQARYAKRGSKQDPTWLKGRQTRVANCSRLYPGTVLVNDTQKDAKENAALIMRVAKGMRRA